MSFWGLVVEANKLYSQTVPMPYRVTMAALGTTDSKSTRTSVILVVDNKDEYVICNLTPSKNDQQNLDLVLQAGAEIAFKVTGERPATVYLTGYYMEAEGNDDEEEEMDSCCEEGEEYDSEMEGFIDDEAIEDEEESDEDEAEFTEEDFSDDDEDDEDEDEDSEGEEEEEPRIKQIEIESDSQSEKAASKKRKEVEAAVNNNKKNKTVEKPAQPTPEDSSKVQSPPKKEATQPKKESTTPSTPSSTSTSQLIKKTLPNGLQIEDISLGEGPKAKKGRKVGITYKGTLSNGKVFDESKGNDILRFTLGKGEVVKGMDLGVEGMALGGVRRLTIPASLGYGSKAIGKIPANSTLIFEVKLAQVNTQQ